MCIRDLLMILAIKGHNSLFERHVIKLFHEYIVKHILCNKCVQQQFIACFVFMKNGKNVNLLPFPRAINHAYNSSYPQLPRWYHTDSRKVRSCLPETVGKKTLTRRIQVPGLRSTWRLDHKCCCREVRWTT